MVKSTRPNDTNTATPCEADLRPPPYSAESSMSKAEKHSGGYSRRHCPPMNFKKQTKEGEKGLNKGLLRTREKDKGYEKVRGSTNLASRCFQERHGRVELVEVRF
jgi:hypothetical protein